MQLAQRYVLVLEPSSDDLQVLRSLFNRLSYDMVEAASADQMMQRAQQEPPCLVILGGQQQNWSTVLVERLRNLSEAHRTTIVALTDSQSPSWLPQDENPGLDGFLVKPLSSDVLTSLVQSAWARQTCNAES
jgi:CheY-like chemotaxis protein